MKNCPNCGYPLEPYKCKCEYCGTWYFDLTAFDMTEDVPYYVKFRTPYGVLTTLARPEVQTIYVSDDYVYAYDNLGNKIHRFTTSRNCDVDVVFHSLVNPGDGSLFRLERDNALD